MDRHESATVVIGRVVCCTVFLKCADDLLVGRCRFQFVAVVLRRGVEFIQGIVISGFQLNSNVVIRPVQFIKTGLFLGRVYEFGWYLWRW